MFHLLQPLGKRKQMSSSDRLPLKPKRDNHQYSSANGRNELTDPVQPSVTETGHRLLGGVLPVLAAALDGRVPADLMPPKTSQLHRLTHELTGPSGDVVTPAKQNGDPPATNQAKQHALPKQGSLPFSLKRQNSNL